MSKSVKLIVRRKSRILLVRRKKDGAWTFPGGKIKRRERPRGCLERELREELPKVKVKSAKRLRKRALNASRHIVYRARKIRGSLRIGDTNELDKVAWRDPQKMRLTKSTRALLDDIS
jgi:8-oxo-dGTP diphosphatase